MTRPTALTICPDGLGYYHRGTYALKVTENYPNGSASANATLIVR